VVSFNLMMVHAREDSTRFGHYMPRGIRNPRTALPFRAHILGDIRTKAVRRLPVLEGRVGRECGGYYRILYRDDHWPCSENSSSDLIHEDLSLMSQRYKHLYEQNLNKSIGSLRDWHS